MSAKSTKPLLKAEATTPKKIVSVKKTATPSTPKSIAKTPTKPAPKTPYESPYKSPLKSQTSSPNSSDSKHVFYLTDITLKKITGGVPLTEVKTLKLSSIDSKMKNIEGLEKLVNLQELDIAGNLLTKMKGMLSQKQLKKLDLSCNAIKAIEGIDHMRLETLNLSKNQIEQIPPTMKLQSALKELNLSHNELKTMTDLIHLKSLADLSVLILNDNPLSSTDHYRLFTIYTLPQLNTLDGEKITDEERQAASQRFQRDEIQALESDKSNLETQLQELQTQMEGVQSKLDEVNYSYIEARQGNNGLQKKLQKVEGELAAKNDVLRAKNAELVRMCELLYEMKQELALINIDKQFSNSNVDAELDRILGENRDVTMELGTQLEPESPYLGKTYHGQRAIDKTLQDKIEQLQKRETELMTEIDGLKKNLRGKEDEIQHLKSTVQSLQEQVADLSDSLKQRETFHENAIDELTAQLMDLRRANEDLASKHSNLENAHLNQAQESAKQLEKTLQEERAQHESTLAELQANQAKWQKEQEEAQKRQAQEQTASEASNAKWKQEQEALHQKRVEELDASLRSLQSTHQEHLLLHEEALEANKKLLQQTQIDAQTQLDTANTQHSSTAAQQVAEWNGEREKLRRECQEWEEKNANLIKQVEELIQAAARKESELKTLQESSSQLQGDGKMAQEEFMRLQTHTRTLEEELVILKRRIVELTEEVSREQAMRTNNQERDSKMMTQMSDLQDKLFTSMQTQIKSEQDAQAAIQKANDERRKLEAELAEYNLQRQSLADQLQQSKSELNKTTALLLAKETQISDLMANKEQNLTQEVRLQAQNDELKRTLEAKAQESLLAQSNLEADLMATKTSNSQLQSELESLQSKLAAQEAREADLQAKLTAQEAREADVLARLAKVVGLIQGMNAQEKALVTEKELRESKERELEEQRAKYERLLAEAQANYAKSLAESQEQHSQSLAESKSQESQALAASQAEYSRQLQEEREKHALALAEALAQHQQSLTESKTEHERALNDMTTQQLEALKELEAHYVGHLRALIKEYPNLARLLDTLVDPSLLEFTTATPESFDEAIHTLRTAIMRSTDVSRALYSRKQRECDILQVLKISNFFHEEDVLQRVTDSWEVDSTEPILVDIQLMQSTEPVVEDVDEEEEDERDVQSQLNTLHNQIWYLLHVLRPKMEVYKELCLQSLRPDTTNRPLDENTWKEYQQLTAAVFLRRRIEAWVQHQSELLQARVSEHKSTMEAQKQLWESLNEVQTRSESAELLALRAEVTQLKSTLDVPEAFLEATYEPVARPGSEARGQEALSKLDELIAAQTEIQVNRRAKIVRPKPDFSSVLGPKKSPSKTNISVQTTTPPAKPKGLYRSMTQVSSYQGTVDYSPQTVTPSSYNKRHTAVLTATEVEKALSAQSSVDETPLVPNGLNKRHSAQLPKNLSKFLEDL